MEELHCKIVSEIILDENSIHIHPNGHSLFLTVKDILNILKIGKEVNHRNRNFKLIYYPFDNKIYAQLTECRLVTVAEVSKPNVNELTYSY